MKPSLLRYLACPECLADLRCESSSTGTDSEVVEGRLTCSSCGRTYPIRKGIPRLVPPNLSVEQRRTVAAFGWEWRHFSELHEQYRDQFLDWIAPLEPGFFAGKVVLDAGCGTGRHAFFAARFGARDVVAMDLSEAVEVAYEHLNELPNAHVVQADIHRPPFKRSDDGGPFDFVYSIGVLHHLPEPRAGFRSLVPLLRPGGTIFGWVYGHENNGFVRMVVTPVRRHLTARIPPSLLRFIAWPLTVLLHTLVKGVYRPLRGTRLFRALPMREYLASLSAFSFRHNYSIVFDHLVAPTAFYLRRAEFERWFREAGLDDIELSWRNENSWRGRGRRADPAPTARERS